MTKSRVQPLLDALCPNTAPLRKVAYCREYVANQKFRLEAEYPLIRTIWDLLVYYRLPKPMNTHQALRYPQFHKRYYNPFFVLVMCGFYAVVLARVYYFIQLDFSFFLLSHAFFLLYEAVLLKHLASFTYFRTFNRENGMVHHHGKRLKNGCCAQFDDLEAYHYASKGFSFSTDNHRLILIDTERDAVFAIIRFHSRYDAVLTWWEWCQYMDKTQPLPDTPVYECERHLDSVTSAFDLAHQRQTDYWRQQSKASFRDWQCAAKLRLRYYFHLPPQTDYSNTFLAQDLECFSHPQSSWKVRLKQALL